MSHAVPPPPPHPVPSPSASSPHQPPLPSSWRGVAIATQVGLGLAGACAVLGALGSLLVAVTDPTVLAAEAPLPDGGAPLAALVLYGAAAVALALVGIATGVLFVIWLYQGSASDRLHGHSPHAPWWAIAGWFVPVLNLWRPHQMVQELYRRARPSQERDRSALVRSWWASLLGSIVLSWVEGRVAARGGDVLRLLPEREQAYLVAVLLDLGSFALLAAAAVLAILVVRRLTADVLAVPVP